MKLPDSDGTNVTFDRHSAVAGEALDAMHLAADGAFAAGRQCWRSVKAFALAAWALHRAARGMRQATFDAITSRV